MRLHKFDQLTTLVSSNLHLIILVLILAVLGSGVLVLLVLRDKVVHVGLGLRELHLVHALTGVPVEECLAPEHSSELLGHALEHLLDGGGVANEGGTHLQALGWDITHGRFDVIGDPLDKVGRVLVLHVDHLLINLLGRHAASEHAGSCQVATVTRIGSTHHVLRIEHLLGQLGHSQCTVLLGSTASQGHEAKHEEVQTRERDHVHSKFAQVRVQLTRETQAACGTGHGGRDKVVQVTVRRGGELKRAEADIVQGFVVQYHNFVGVLNKLVHGKSGVVRLNNGVRHLGGWEHGEGKHNPVGVFLTDLGDKRSTHARAGSATHGVGDLETLEAIARLRLFADNIQNGVNQLGSFGVVALGPVVASTSLAENEVVRTEQLSERTRADGVHGTGLKVHEDGTGNISSTSGLVVVHIDALELQIGITFVGPGWVNAVLIRDDFPEFSSDLVATLAGLDVNEFAHVE